MTVRSSMLIRAGGLRAVTAFVSNIMLRLVLISSLPVMWLWPFGGEYHPTVKGLFAFEGVLGGAYRGVRVVVVRWSLRPPVWMRPRNPRACRLRKAVSSGQVKVVSGTSRSLSYSV